MSETKTNGSMTNAEAMAMVAQYRALTSIMLDRMAFMRQAGITFDGLRDEYEIFGYDRLISAKQYRDEYARGGLAKAIVDCYPKATWRGGVEVFEDEDPKVSTQFEKDWLALVDQHNVWNKLQAVDTLSGLSTYAVMLIGAPGELEMPLPKGKPGAILYLSPFPGGGGPGPNQNSIAAQDSFVDATIKELETDIRNPRFGLPKLYQLKRTDVSNPALQKPVHWSRVLHVAEGCLDNEIYGPPWLECVWNLLIDLRKVTGGGAEAFFSRADQGMHIDIDKDVQITEPQKQDLRDQIEEYNHKITRALRTRGAKVTMLGSDVANFASPVDAIIKQIAGTKRIPLRMLTGSEQGELASSQDEGNWITQVQDRRTGYAGPLIVRRFVDRLIEFGYLSKPAQYEVGWPVEEDLDETEKADLAVKLATANKTFGSLLFTDDFIRDKTFDLEPLTDEERKADSDRAAERMQAQQDAMGGPTGGGNVVPFKAAADVEMLRVLTAAIQTGNTAVIERVLELDRKAVLPVPVHYGTADANSTLCGRQSNPEFIVSDKQSVTCANCLNLIGGQPGA
jgi:hypothetical protein